MMIKLSQTPKISAVHVGFLASFGLMSSLFASGIAMAHPAKYRNTQVNPILIMVVADDFRAPPTKFGIQIANTSLASADDFRAPPSDSIQTGSTNKPKYCSRVTYKNCGPHH